MSPGRLTRRRLLAAGLGALVPLMPAGASPSAAGPGGGSPAGVRARLLPDSPGFSALAAISRSGAPTEPTLVADTATGRSIRVVPREHWGADEAIRFKNGRESWLEMFVPPRLIVVHHTATRNSYADAEAAMAEVRSIHRFHTLGRDWGDIGYHAIIDRFGNIYEGRHGRGGDAGDERDDRETLSHSVTGGHTTEYEYGTVGVALLGNATAPDWDLTGPMWNALVRYCAFEAARHGLVPMAAGGAAVTNFLRSDDIWHDGVQVICPHREVQATACPGDAVVDVLPDLRSAVTSLLADLRAPGLRLTSLHPPAREIGPGTLVTFAATPGPPTPVTTPAARLEYALEGWYKPPDSEDLDYLLGYLPGRQPEVAWMPLADGEEVSFTAALPGHYTIHVRAVSGPVHTPVASADRLRATFVVRTPGAFAGP